MIPNIHPPITMRKHRTAILALGQNESSQSLAGRFGINSLFNQTRFYFWGSPHGAPIFLRTFVDKLLSGMGT